MLHCRVMATNSLLLASTIGPMRERPRRLKNWPMSFQRLPGIAFVYRESDRCRSDSSINSGAFADSVPHVQSYRASSVDIPALPPTPVLEDDLARDRKMRARRW